MRIEIPSHPPSANRIWRSLHGHGRVVRSREYRAWLAYVPLVQIQARGATIGKPWAARIVLHGLSRRADIDNFAKATLDLLVRSGVTPDDRFLDHLIVERRPGKPRRTVIIIHNLRGP